MIDILVEEALARGFITVTTDENGEPLLDIDIDELIALIGELIKTFFLILELFG